MNHKILIAQALQEPFFIKQSAMDGFLDILATTRGNIDVVGHIPNKARDSVTLQKITSSDGKNALAVLTVGGAMYKHDMSDICVSVASYEKIQEKAQMAENMYKSGEIGLLVKRVTTPGGGLFGLNAMETMLSRLTVPTITYAEDQMCSAGVYAFMGSDKICAAPMTEIGSIGVVVDVIRDKKKKYKSHVSRRARNKRPDLETKEGQAILQKELDEYEDKFYSIVQKNTNFTEKQIEKEFNQGGVILSEKALEIGFIDEVIVFEDLIERELKNMGGNQAANVDTTMSAPTASGEKLAQNSTAGVKMSKMATNEDILALENSDSNFNAMKVQLITRNDKIANLEQSIKDMQNALDNKSKEIEGLNSKLSEAVSKEDADTLVAEAKKETTATATARVSEAYETGVADQSIINKMIEASSDKEASDIALSAKPSTVALVQSQTGSNDVKTGIDWYAQNYMKGGSNV